MNTQNVSNINFCTGCGACKNICPVEAISMKFNAKGFYSPIIDFDKCINCGKCKIICPSIKYVSRNNNIMPKCFAISASDEERFNSTSGAFFPILAKWVLNNNGYVCGAAWDKDWNVEHIIINKLNDLSKLRCSKYVQSNTNNCFLNIKKLLEDDNYVLFSGTPCQNAGLYSFLGKEYEKLITIDLLCHGNPSPKVWQEYLNENFNIENITDINFRSHNRGWMSTSQSCYDIDGGYIKVGQEKFEIGVYYEAFLKHILSNDACMECKYKFISRPADFTCGDFWRYYKYDKNLNDNKGLSIVLANNEKAKKYLDLIKNNFKLFKPINLKKKWHNIEITNKTRLKTERTLFFNKYQKGQISTTKLINAALNKHYDVGFLSFFNGLNYGSSLVAYAANSIIESLGYSVLNIHKRISNHYMYDEYHLPYKFAINNYFISREFGLTEQPYELNNVCESFVLGSDTLWWWDDVQYTNNHFWLDFANSQKKKISFCTSFGFDKPCIPIQKQTELKYLYSRFDALSTREGSGVNILNDYFACNSVALCDPTFIAEKSIFEDLAKKSERKDKNYIIAYILDIDINKKQELEHFAQRMGLQLILIPNMHRNYSVEKTEKKKINILIEDFLYLVKNAEFVITDSFHGACFSVIFEKKFAAIINSKRGTARYKIFEQMNLNKHFISSYAQLKNFSLDLEPDFSDAKRIIAEKKENGLNWLKGALEKQKTNIDKADLLYDFIYLNTEERIKKDYYSRNNKKIKYLYWKYKLLENFTLGKTKNRYKKKKNIYKKILISIDKE